jgi:hypothetical protein
MTYDSNKESVRARQPMAMRDMHLHKSATRHSITHVAAHNRRLITSTLVNHYPDFSIQNDT